MYSRQETSDTRKKFWTSFGKYLSPIFSAGGTKVNWINYKTGIRFIQFRTDVSDHAYIAIEISHNDPADRKLVYDHLFALKNDLEEKLGEEWRWEEETDVRGETIARIFTTLENVNIYKEADWPQIISFLKPRLLALDEFWNEYREIFEMISPGK